MDDSLVGWVIGSLSGSSAGDSLIGWAAASLAGLDDSRIGFAVNILEPEIDSDSGLRVYTNQGLVPAAIRTWTQNGWA